MCNNNSDSIIVSGSSSNRTSVVDIANPVEETGEEYEDDYAYEDQENGSSVDIETEADDDESNFFEAQFQRVERSWLATAESGAASNDIWHYNERAYEELCYVTFSSEVITTLLCLNVAILPFT